MGMIIYPLLNSTNINTIKIVENNQDIIDFVYPKIQERDTNSKVTVVNGDSNTWHLTDKSKYDFIYFDTAKTPSESIDSESTLKPLYLKNKRTTNSIIHFWCLEIKDLL
jgi:spermidine synthase